MVQIIEIKNKAKNARANPFLCRDSKGELYYVKNSKGAAFTSLCYEWIAGHLAKALELPIPDFTLAEVSDLLIDYSENPDVKTFFGAGTAFASKNVENVQDVTWAQLQSIDKNLKAEILFFDWIIQNIDRHLSDKGGNPNMLFNASAKQVYIIDHDNAFEMNFDFDEFWLEHPLKEAFKLWDDQFMAEKRKQLESFLLDLREICNSIPEEWHFESKEIPSLELSYERISSIIERCRTESFWRPTECMNR